MILRPFALNLRHLRSLSAAVGEGTLSAAAARVGLSQPALTQGLSKLERQLGQAMFERHPGGLLATAAGGVMAERTDAAFCHLALASRHRGARRGFSRPDQLMTATQLDAFLHVADAGSFVGAAVAHGVSQPALHRAVRDLEQIVGVPLVERRGRGSALTEYGRRLARGVRLAEREIAAGIAEITAGPAGGGRIVVGAMPLSRALLLPRAVAALAREAPGVVVEVVEGSWRELVEPLADGVLDLTVGALRAAPPAGCEQRPLFSDRVAIIGRAGHPLAGVATPTPDQLAAYPWAIGPSGSPLEMQWRGLFADRPLPAAPIVCGSVIVLRGVLRDSDLLTLLSPDQVALEIAAGLLATIGSPLAGSDRIIGITTRMGWRPTAYQRRMLALIDEVAAALSVQENE